MLTEQPPEQFVVGDPRSAKRDHRRAELGISRRENVDVGQRRDARTHPRHHRPSPRRDPFAPYPLLRLRRRRQRDDRRRVTRAILVPLRAGHEGHRHR